MQELMAKGEWRRPVGLFLLGVALCGQAMLRAGLEPVPLLRSEFPSDRASTAFNYSPTLAQTAEGLVLAWVGGSGVDSPDASIYLIRLKAGQHDEVEGGGVGDAAYRQKVAQTFLSAYGPCQRPVLFQPEAGVLLLFYKTTKAGKRTRGWLSVSRDNGITWFKAKALPRSISGPARTSPLKLAEGVFLCGSDSHHAGRRIHIERAQAFRSGWGWTRTRPLSTAMRDNASEPALLNHGGGRLQALCRTRLGHIAQIWSENNGKTWGTVEPTALPNPNSGLDAASLGDGRFVLVYQHTNQEQNVLNLALTEDGRNWSAAAVLEHQPGKRFSDPSILLGADGNLHVVYSVNQQQIKHIALDPRSLKPVSMLQGNWPY